MSLDGDFNNQRTNLIQLTGQLTANEVDSSNYFAMIIKVSLL